MKTNNTFTDIYSHSSSLNNRNSKSRGRIKSVLCFLLCFAMFLSLLFFYCLGIYVENSKNKPAVNTDNKYNTPQNDLTQTVELSNAINTVVGLYIYNDKQESYASGVIISQDGYIVTADHIFKNIFSPKILVYDSLGNYYEAAFIGGDIKSDVSVIKIEKTNLPYSDINSKTNANIGETVFSIGCPMDKSLSMSVTSGIISGKNRRFKTDTGQKSLKMLQTDAPINPGSSGGGLFNSKGELIGINCSKVVDESYEGVGFIIPNEVLSKVVNDLIQYGSVRNRACLGFSYECCDYTNSLKLGKNCGLVVKTIKINSGLYGMGVNPSDIIISINGKKIYDEEIFLDEIENYNIGESINLVISDNSFNQYEISVKLIEDNPSTNYIGWIKVKGDDKNITAKEG